MHSLYRAPAAASLALPLSVHTLRWAGAAVFAAMPLLALLVLQSAHFHEHRLTLGWRTLEPAFYLIPIVAVMGSSGFALAPRCAATSKLRALAIALAMCLAWGLTVQIAGNLLVFMRNSQIPPGWEHQLSISQKLLAIFLPIALVKVYALRFYARRQVQPARPA